nr:hypothetical protein 2 - Rhizobium leguminosarum bv. phaseoli [Rhizobium leguminosarum bv. phaseoli]AAA98209.1 ORF2 [Plasmid p42d]
MRFTCVGNRCGKGIATPTMSREFTFALGTVRNEPRIDRFKRGGLVTVFWETAYATRCHTRVSTCVTRGVIIYLWAAGLECHRIIYRKDEKQ